MSYFFFFRQGLSLNLKLTYTVRPADQPTSGTLLSHFPVPIAMTTEEGHHVWLCKWVLGRGSLCLSAKHFSDWVTSPSLDQEPVDSASPASGSCYHHTPRPFPQPYGTAFASSLTPMKREVVSFCSKFYISIWSTNFIKKSWQPAYNDFGFFSTFPWDEVLGETGEEKVTLLHPTS